MTGHAHAYAADASLKGKLRRRWSRLGARRAARFALERPMLSISFDDVPASAATDGARLLERCGARGTFYVSAGLCGRDAPTGRCAVETEVRALAVAGHEVACHTWSHLDCGRADAGRIGRDVELNRAVLTELTGATPETFAFPYGDVSLRAKRILRRRFRALRGLHEGLVEDGCDLNQLPAVGIEGADGEARAAAWIDRAAARKAWLVLYTHDVSATPSAWGCTPEALERLIERALARGFELHTVARGLDRIGAAA
jgi:peptidoglycan/xylan/chitin deacetylase (PgdA/CDA1 family)